MDKPSFDDPAPGIPSFYKMLDAQKRREQEGSDPAVPTPSYASNMPAQLGMDQTTKQVQPTNLQPTTTATNPEGHSISTTNINPDIVSQVQKLGNFLDSFMPKMEPRLDHFLWQTELTQ